MGNQKVFVKWEKKDQEIEVNGFVTPKELVEYGDQNDELGEFDLLGTLSNFYDPNFIDEHSLEIENDYEIYHTPIAQLVNDYMLYDYIEKKYGN